MEVRMDSPNKYQNTKIQKYQKKTKKNSPAPAINTQKEKKAKREKKCKNMQKEQQNKKMYFRASY